MKWLKLNILKLANYGCASFSHQISDLFTFGTKAQSQHLLFILVLYLHS